MLCESCAAVGSCSQVNSGLDGTFASSLNITEEFLAVPDADCFEETQKTKPACLHAVLCSCVSLSPACPLCSLELLQANDGLSYLLIDIDIDYLFEFYSC